jgi:HrpA-like RNA helicase
MMKGKKKKKKSDDVDESDEEEERAEMEEEEEEEDARPMTAHEKMQIGRKKLPVYKYKEEFLAAVQDNKVLVIMAEVN